MEKAIVVTARQEVIRNAVKLWSNSGRTLVEVVQSVLVDFYGVDSQSCDNLQFLINELHGLGHKRYVSAVIKLLPLYVFVTVDFDRKANTYSVTNTKGIPKAQKAKGKANLEACAWDAIISLLQHPALNGGKPKAEKAEKAEKAAKKSSVSVEVETDPLAQVTFRDVARRELENGITLQQLIDVLAELAGEMVEKAA